MNTLEPDRDQLEIFVEALLRHAGGEGYVSLRSFLGNDKVLKPIQTVKLKGTEPRYLVDVAVDQARRAANNPEPAVFCPPIATFNGPGGWRAREVDLLKGLVLSVEADAHPEEARTTLEEILGAATVIVRSGGQWVDPADGRPQDKLHFHWRLARPAVGSDELAKLKQARRLATALVGADPTNIPAVHCLRWPGSWHRKGEPRLCEIVAARPDVEIDLDAALEALLQATPAPASKPADSHDSDEDNSDPESWPALVAGVISGENYHGALRDLAARLVGSNVLDGSIVKLLRGLMEASTAPRDERWQARYDGIPRAVSTAREKYAEENRPSATQAPIQWLNMANWDTEPRPQREWAILDRVPNRQVGLFSGEGGTGKSIIEMMKDVAHVAGKDWFGSMPTIGPAWYVGAEDDEKEIHIRFYDIAAHYRVTFKELIENGLKVLCLLGQDATLCASTGKSGKVETTALYRQLYEAAGDLKPKNISVDTLSRAFAGNEIDRAQVYGFATHMQALSMVADGSVTILSHPSLQGIASGSGISGSTAWHGAFRFRQYLRPPKSTASGDEPDTDIRELEFKKNQYGPRGTTVTVRYRDGVFAPLAQIAPLAQLAEEAKVDALFLTLLDKFTAQQRYVTDKSGKSYAPSEFEKSPHAAGVKSPAFACGMQRLFAQNKISMAPRPGSSPSKQDRLVIARGEEGQ